ncbi:MAG TPA: phasin family protein [Thermoanaerobaculia bacterium]|jgi:poly(hydroxyalkanoate) granule-associated protein|nr:phasin family protein [Thermoanaerobaculia bacterium]
MNQLATVLDISKPIDRLFTAGRNLFLAGVGAVAEVSEGGMEMFDRLVERGKPFEDKQKQRVEAVVERANQTVRGANQLLQDTVEFESRGVLKRLNVMTREDVKILSARIATLSKKVDEVVERRQAATMDVIEIVSPEGEAVAILTSEALINPQTATAAASAKKASKPRQRKTTKKG